MKLPFDLGLKLFFRLLIPGFFVALGLLPIINMVLKWLDRADKLEYGFIITIILAGWIIIVSDMWVYMILEGRKFWPDFLWSYFVSLEEARLKRIRDRIELFDDNKPQDLRSDKQNLEDYFELRRFPMSDSGEYKIEMPSRLGNLIYAYEGYSKRIYGMSSILYWNRILLEVDKDLREELDSKQAVADSTVYTSFALYVAGIFWLSYALLLILHLLVINQFPWVYNYVPAFKVTIIENLPSLTITLISSLSFILAGFILYRISLPLHAQYGELFKATFDFYQEKINISQVIREVVNATGNKAFFNLNRKAKLNVAWRFQQYYRVRCPNPECSELMKPSDMKTHDCAPKVSPLPPSA
ncbi:MAG TPA: hypothetical protein VGX92_02640 [Pyrinomonadaceae bacterium]|jgi:hypothetical protein|nr:hypothetical protein [Pyrinomonadaceae bacterium]